MGLTYLFACSDQLIAAAENGETFVRLKQACGTPGRHQTTLECLYSIILLCHIKHHLPLFYRYKSWNGTNTNLSTICSLYMQNVYHQFHKNIFLCQGFVFLLSLKSDYNLLHVEIDFFIKPETLLFLCSHFKT